MAEYTITRDVSGYRVVFTPALGDRVYDQPQHKTVAAARQWAKEILSLEAEADRLETLAYLVEDGTDTPYHGGNTDAVMPR